MQGLSGFMLDVLERALSIAWMDQDGAGGRRDKPLPLGCSGAKGFEKGAGGKEFLEPDPLMISGDIDDVWSHDRI